MDSRPNDRNHGTNNGGGGGSRSMLCHNTDGNRTMGNTSMRRNTTDSSSTRMHKHIRLADMRKHMTTMEQSPLQIAWAVRREQQAHYLHIRRPKDYSSRRWILYSPHNRFSRALVFLFVLDGYCTRSNLRVNHPEWSTRRQSA